VSALTRGRIGGPVIPWIGPVYLDNWLRLGLVTEIGEPVPTPPPAPVDLDADEATLDAAAPDSGAVDECVATLARLQVPATAGAPAARTALRGNGSGSAMVSLPQLSGSVSPRGPGHRLMTKNSRSSNSN
jgi:hypothetical protein